MFSELTSSDAAVSEGWLSEDPVAGLKKVSDMIPGRFRIGDFNSDGFPDIIATVENLNNGTFTQVLLNSACPVKGSGCSKRALISQTIDEYSLLKSMSSPQYAFFFDIDENGRQDIMYMSKVGNKPIQVKAIYNNLIEDHFYLKSLFHIQTNNTQ